MNNTKKVYYKVTYLLDDDAAEASGYDRYNRYFKGDTLGECEMKAYELREPWEAIIREQEITCGEYRRGRRKEAHKPRKCNASCRDIAWERYLAPARKYKTRRVPF